MRLLACIDGSDHDAAVCDYAAWLSGPTEHEIDLLHAIEGDSDAAFENAERSLSAATARLSDCGLETLRRVTQRGAFLEVAETMTSSHSILVVGRRGEGDRADGRHIGSNIAPLLQRTEQPVCLVSHPYLPIGRILVLLDANPEHRRMVEFIRDQAWLRDLAPDIAVFAPAGASDEKLIWARDVLEASPIELRRLEANCPHEAVEHYRRDHRVDLVVLSREVALSEGGALCGADGDDLWSRRAPVLVC